MAICKRVKTVQHHQEKDMQTHDKHKNIISNH